jgi:protein SCO1/2
MTQPARKIEWMVWAGVALITLTLILVVALVVLKSRLTAAKPLPVYGAVGEFALTNQNQQLVTLAGLRGRVWVADIIFTRCAGPCPVMTRFMSELQQSLDRSGSQARLVTLTTDPEFDTPKVLRQYAERFNADTNRWVFLTGTKRQIASLATTSLKLTGLEKAEKERQSPEDLFIHSTIFVVVDKQGRLRGTFQTTGEGVDPAVSKAQILATVRQLERES